MNNEYVSDEMLMAYADGELEAKERAEIAALAAVNPLIAGRIARFAQSRQVIGNAFSATLAEPVPDYLIDTVLGDRTRAAPRQDNRFIKAIMPLAACLMLVAGICGYVIGTAQTGTAPRGMSFIAAATGAPLLDSLARAPSGEEVSVDDNGVSIVATATGTYPVVGGMCRIYDAQAGGESLRGVACIDGGNWSVPVTVATGARGYHPASETSLMVIDSFLDGIEADADIGVEAEALLIGNGWQ
jgi:anti-sigma factor RsiW